MNLKLGVFCLYLIGLENVKKKKKHDHIDESACTSCLL